MARFLKAKKEAIGLSPYELRFLGEQKLDFVKLRLINYSENQLEERELASISEIKDFQSEEAVSWVNIDGLHDTRVLEELIAELKIDKLVVADVLDTHRRPKLQEYDNCLYVSVKMLQFDDDEDQITSENLVLVFNNNLLISFQERVGDVFNPIRERLRKNKKRIRSANADYLAFALLDVVIDNYLHIISRLGEKIEDLDDELIEKPSSDSLVKINTYKVEISYLRKIIKPCREMIQNLCRLDSELIDDSIQVHLDELRHNIELANEAVDNYRDILSDQLNIFHTTVAYKLNDVLKMLTIFSVIFIPITFIAGVYGTNFDHIPELHYQYSYFIMWGVIIITVLVMLWYFKRKKWL
ncbi:magnesium/cobalt transporter CorA [Carboxylicivirga mesophila]|uniref:Magnesium transport protein CorA n=1 Tax=Carboxylicivirga mesophila TaxID=1166478 RepID=A0ABS5KBD8_9BACT|nr:magnesium/cobalt transporter CorA [Carboxylicivirga mesophila]MBS2212207.1 magnesium/cobalt transporter CorA [Carboxylicivirga mesophila]